MLISLSGLSASLGSSEPSLVLRYSIAAIARRLIYLPAIALFITYLILNIIFFIVYNVYIVYINLYNLSSPFAFQYCIISRVFILFYIIQFILYSLY